MPAHSLQPRLRLVNTDVADGPQPLRAGTTPNALSSRSERPTPTPTPPADRRVAIHHAPAQGFPVLPPRPARLQAEPSSNQIFARAAALSLEHGRAAVLTPERRARLMRLAQSLNLRSFEASLTIALAQDAARHGADPSAPVAPAPLSSHAPYARLSIHSAGLPAHARSTHGTPDQAWTSQTTRSTLTTREINQPTAHWKGALTVATALGVCWAFVILGWLLR